MGVFEELGKVNVNATRLYDAVRLVCINHSMRLGDVLYLAQCALLHVWLTRSESRLALVVKRRGAGTRICMWTRRW